jgi:hypothetical protein
MGKRERWLVAVLSLALGKIDGFAVKAAGRASFEAAHFET